MSAFEPEPLEDEINDIELGQRYGHRDDANATDANMETVKQTPMQRMKTLVVYVGLSLGVGMSVAAMAIFHSSVSVIIMGLVLILNAPYAAFKEMSLGKLPTLRALNNKMREDVNNLTDQVDLLTQEVDALKPEADRLAQGEEELKAIAETQNAQVTTIVELVKENAEIQAQMRDNLRQVVVQDMISIIVNSDRDNDQTISESEGKRLALQIDIALKQHGVDFDQGKFLKVIDCGSDGTGKGTAVHAIIEIVTRLLHTGDLEHKDEEEGNTDVNSDSEDKEEEDVYDMFHVAEGNDRMSLGSGNDGEGLSLLKSDDKRGRRRSRSKFVIKKVIKESKNKAKDKIEGVMA
mmetsp:Transcript_25585/g.54024  ORF Transcript_25585/g.54024 Transcript_25585/m.54024 type:complete len:349 (+) Transcript_25585:104-1150(+)